MGRSRTTRCCSAGALIVTAAIASITQIAATLGAQGTRPGAEISSLFPIRPVWTLALNNQLVAPPAYFESHAYFAIEGDRLVAYELETGSQEWIVPAQVKS